MRASTSMSATGSPHTVAARNGIKNAQFLEHDPVLVSNPQFSQEGVVFLVPSCEGSNKKTLNKHLKALLFKTVLRTRVLFHLAIPGCLEVVLRPPRDRNINQVGFLGLLIEDDNIWPALSLAVRGSLVLGTQTAQNCLQQSVHDAVVACWNGWHVPHAHIETVLKCLNVSRAPSTLSLGHRFSKLSSLCRDWQEVQASLDSKAIYSR